MEFKHYLIDRETDQIDGETAAKRRCIETPYPRMSFGPPIMLTSSSNMSSSEDLEDQSSDTEAYTNSLSSSSGYPNSSGSESKSEDTDERNATKKFLPLQNCSVSLVLEKGSLWDKFIRLGTEMIINRTGRRMFPYVEFTLRGLDPLGVYDVMLDIIPADNQCFKFLDNEWVPVGEAEQDFQNELFKHPESPKLGSEWMAKIISFQNVKLSNQPSSKCGIFTLRSLQKYLVKISLIKHKTERFPVLEIPIKSTTFVAVTAYNSREVTELKIQTNPYSKAFRFPRSRMRKNSVSAQKGINSPHKRNSKSQIDMIPESYEDIRNPRRPLQSPLLLERRPSPSTSEELEVKSDQDTQTDLSMADGNLWCMLPACQMMRNLLNMASSPSYPRNMNQDIDSLRQYFHTL